MNGTIEHTVYGKTIKTYKVKINAYWVDISRENKTVFKREATDDSWLDKKHVAITNALAALDKALNAAIE